LAFRFSTKVSAGLCRIKGSERLPPVAQAITRWRGSGCSTPAAQCDYQQFLQELEQLLAKAEVPMGIREEVYFEGGPHVGFDHKCADRTNVAYWLAVGSGSDCTALWLRLSHH